MEENMSYELPKLPYAYDALEPYIDARTMEIHHTKHHQAYLTKLLDAGIDQNKKIEEVLLSDDRPVVQNNGGGFYNHMLFWQMMSPKGGGEPKGEVLKAIDSHFGSFDEFQKKFTDAAATQFGSGWAWLVKKGNELKIVQRPNQNHPLNEGLPLLGIDVWEHAYYLNYQNRRPDYIKAWWNVVNWDYVASKFEEAKSMAI